MYLFDVLLFFIIHFGVPSLGILLFIYFVRSNQAYSKKKKNKEEIPWKIKFHCLFSLELLLLAITIVVGILAFIYYSASC